MKTFAVLLLLWVYGISISGFIEIFKILNKDLLVISYSSEHLSYIFGIIGIILGIGYYFLSTLPKKFKKLLTIAIPTALLLIVLFSYLIADLAGLFTMLYNLIKIGIFFVISGIPSIASYSLLKNQKNVLLACSAGIMVFFFMIVLLSQMTGLNLLPIYSEEKIALLILFFIFLLTFIELGNNSIYYTDTLKKMTPNEYIEQDTLFRFNRVINRQIVYSGIVLIICYFTTFILFWNNNYNRYFQLNKIFGIEATSYFGIILLVFFTLTGLTILWFLIPQEKKQNETLD